MIRYALLLLKFLIVIVINTGIAFFWVASTKEGNGILEFAVLQVLALLWSYFFLRKVGI